MKKVVLVGIVIVLLTKGITIDALVMCVIWWWMVTVSGIIGSRYEEVYKHF